MKKMTMLSSSLLTNLLPFIGWVLGVSLWQLDDKLWVDYLRLIAGNIIWVIPLIAYYGIHKLAIVSKTKRRALVLWTCIYVVYPSSIFIYSFDNDVFHGLLLVFGGLLIEVARRINARWRHVKRQDIWRHAIGMDSLILSLLGLVAIYVGLLITSDLTLWYQSNSVPSAIDFHAALAHWPTLVSVSIQLFLLFLCGFIFYWLNRHFLIKNLLRTHGFITYLTGSALTVCILSPILMSLYLQLPINSMAEPIIPAVDANPFDWANTRVFIAVLVISLPIITVIEWHQKSNDLTLLKQQSTQTELQLLKQQINPHFFFNTLNNLYALTRKKSAQAPDVVLQLSDLMHYVVYQAQESTVPIAKELQYIDDYIALQSIRLAAHHQIQVEHDIDNEQTSIAPLLLIILIENAFKHGIEISSAPAKLTLIVTLQRNILSVECVNSIADNSMQQVDVKLGVGLTNLQRRLALIYPERHQLHVELSSSQFTARLEIDLNDQSQKELLNE